MPALLPVLLAVAVPAGAQAPDAVRPAPEPSPALAAALGATARELRKSETGRRLAAVTASLRVVERPHQLGSPLRYEGGARPALVVDADRAPGLSALDFELLSVQERWKAAAGLPAEVLDGAMAARQAVLEHALGKADVDPDFAARLRAATSKARAELEARRRQGAWAEARGGSAAAFFPGAAPSDALALLAYELYLYGEDPYLFYRHAAAGLPAGTPSYDEAAEFLERHEAELSRLESKGGGAYALIEGRLYEAGPARVAKAMGRDGLRRLGERLGDFRGAAREALLKKVNAWLRAAP